MGFNGRNVIEELDLSQLEGRQHAAAVRVSTLVYQSAGTRRGIAMNRHPAFTLLELLIAMALVAVIALSLAASVKTAFNTQPEYQASRPPIFPELVMDFLRNDLQCACPRRSFWRNIRGSHGQGSQRRRSGFLHHGAVAACAK